MNESEIISAEEAVQLNEARDLLNELTERAKSLGWMPKVESFSLGKFSEAGETAEDAVFAVLNIASAHLGCTAADNAINDRLRSREAARNV